MFHRDSPLLPKVACLVALGVGTGMSMIFSEANEEWSTLGKVQLVLGAIVFFLLLGSLLIIVDGPPHRSGELVHPNLATRLLRSTVIQLLIWMVVAGMALAWLAFNIGP
jgi:hypothetical protein